MDAETQRKIFGLTAQNVFHRLHFLDINEVCAPCFQEGSFTLAGEVKCRCDRQGSCREEYICEVLAAHILMPEIPFRADLLKAPALANQGVNWVGWLASRYEVERWAVCFRICLLEEGYFSPYGGGWLMGMNPFGKIVTRGCNAM